ncbi:MAG TPA: hypothetical protein VNT51_09350 [Miltoncostaeaceae bacterium]|nr:hypothetical protein [Miltoncostaeaceae bacterium]
MPTRRAVFSMCGRAATDARFPRYPPLPVGRCIEWEGRPPGPGAR